MPQLWLSGIHRGTILPARPSIELLRRVRIEKTKAYIEKNLHRQMTLEEVSREVGLSPFHFTRAFKRAFGMTACQYVQTRRVALAVTMIEARKHTLAQVAGAVGFNSQAHMNRVFRDVIGMTPGQVLRRVLVLLVAVLPAVDLAFFEGLD